MICEGKLCSVMNIPVEHIFPNPYQPRKVFAQTDLDELAVSIREYGVIQPITVRKMAGGKYELVSGERRLRASKLANKESIAAIIVDINDNDAAIIALVENLQRRDLTFFEEAEGYYHLLHDHKLTQEALSAKLGKTQSAVANKLRLLKLSAAARKKICEHGLTERHARALLRLPTLEDQERVLDIICEKKLNVGKAEDLIDKELNAISEARMFERARAHVTGRHHDLRICYNTINKAIDMVNKLGIATDTRQTEYSDYVEFVIKIHK